MSTEAERRPQKSEVKLTNFDRSALLLKRKFGKLQQIESGPFLKKKEIMSTKLSFRATHIRKINHYTSRCQS